MFIAIVPAFNEENKVGSVVRSLFDHVDQVVVVNDASKDNTKQKAQEAGAVVLSHKINRGQGAALETGHEYARANNADYIIHFDADGQFEVSDILPALNKLKDNNADILFGSRFLDKKVKNKIPTFKKYIILPLAKLFEKISGTIKLTDSHNGFRILNKKALHNIIITQDRMAHASQIPKLVMKNNLQYIEHPITVIYHEYGQGLTGGVKIIKDLIIGKFLKN